MPQRRKSISDFTQYATSYHMKALFMLICCKNARSNHDRYLQSNLPATGDITVTPSNNLSPQHTYGIVNPINQALDTHLIFITTMMIIHWTSN